MTRQEVIKRIALSAKETLDNSYRVYINCPVVYRYRDIPLNDCIKELSRTFYENDPLNQLNILYNNDASIDSYELHVRNKLGSDQSDINNEWVPSSATLKAYGIKCEAIADIAIAHNDKIVEYIFIQFNDTHLLDQYLMDAISDAKYYTIKISTPPIDIYYAYYNKNMHTHSSTSLYTAITRYYRSRRAY